MFRNTFAILEFRVTAERSERSVREFAKKHLYPLFEQHGWEVSHQGHLAIGEETAVLLIGATKEDGDARELLEKILESIFVAGAGPKGLPKGLLYGYNAVMLEAPAYPDDGKLFAQCLQEKWIKQAVETMEKITDILEEVGDAARKIHEALN